MLSILDGNTILSVFIVIALGTLFGKLPFGPIRFGAAGALFVGLAVGAFVIVDHAALSLLQSLGLGLFVYMLGLTAGEVFFRGLKEQVGLMVAAVVAVCIGAAVALGLGTLLGMPRFISVGVFAGSLTSTPSMAVAQQQTGSDLPAVGYSLGYPVGVVVSILLIAVAMKLKWESPKDKKSGGVDTLHIISVQVTTDAVFQDLVDNFAGRFVIISTRRDGKTTVASDYVDIRKGDILRILVSEGDTSDIVQLFGRRTAPMPFLDKALVIDEFVVSNHLVAGAKVEELQLHKNFQARIVRVFRGDDAILAYKDTHIAYGDRVEVIIDADRREDVSAFFGDSIKQYAALNWISVAGGLSIGYLAALIEIPLPGGGSFALGTALGPLFAGLILGTLKRTGGVAWQVPASANTSLQQLGLMIFLAAAGLNAGRAFAATAFSLNGLLAMILGIAVVIAVIAGFILCARLFGKAVERASGGGCGMLGQPAVLQYALANSSDPRVMEGYTSVFAIALILKIFIIPFMLL